MFDSPTAIAARLRAPLLLALAIGLAWIAIDLLVYRSGLYLHFAEPDSNTGAVVTKLMMVERQYVPGARNIAVFGDSRVGEGFSPQAAAAGDATVNFVNLAVPGSTPRTWYYLLREIDRRGYRFDAVVVGTLYRDPITGPRADWPLDAAHALPLVDLRDTLSFPATFDAATQRERARHAVLFPALALRDDATALLRHPLQRARKIFAGRPGFLDAVRNYAGRDTRMPDLAFDGTTPRIPDTVTATERTHIDSAQRDARPPPPAVAEANDAFLGMWLQRMADLARGQDAVFVTYPLPRGPYRTMQGDEAPLSPALQRLQADGAIVLPANLLAELEAPAFFFDALHANRPGRERTGTVVGERVRALLAQTTPDTRARAAQETPR